MALSDWFVLMEHAVLLACNLVTLWLLLVRTRAMRPYRRRQTRKGPE